MPRIIGPICRFLAIALLAGICAHSARAEYITGLYNTGVDNSGGLAADRSADLHYSLIASADPSIHAPASAYVADSSSYPFVPGGWLPDGPLSKWITPIPDQSLGNPPGNYTYRTTFQLSGGDPGSVLITGKWTLDNIGEDIVINGHSTGIYYAAPGDYSFKSFSTFVLPSNYFVDGTNTIDFVVDNADNGNGNTPTGLRVELSGTTVAPEPASVSLVAFGVITMIVYRRVRPSTLC